MFFALLPWSKITYLTVKSSVFDYKNILDLTVEYVFDFYLSQKSQPQPLLKQKHVLFG